MLPLPAVAVTVPPQVLLTLGVLATTSVALPAPPLTGSVSLKVTPLRSAVALVFGLLIVKVTVLVPFFGMLVGLNALLIVGGPTTVKFAEAVFPVPPLPEDTLPVVFVYWPAVAPVTVTLTTHWPFAGIVTPPI